MKRFKIVFITLLSVLLVCAAVFAACLSQPTIKKNLKYWQDNDYSELQYGSRLSQLLPTYEEENNYCMTNFYYHKGNISFNYAEAAYCLELDFSESDYNQSKESAINNFNFLEEIPIYNEKLSIDEPLPVSDYSIGNYEIRLIDVSDAEIPHEIEFVAFDDSNKRLRYGYIVDMSLDYFDNETTFRNWITNNLNIGW